MKFKRMRSRLVMLLAATWVSLPAFACHEGMAINDSNVIQSEAAELGHPAKDQELYNFHTHHCDALSSLQGDGQVSDHLPMDEESLGLYSLYRSKGEDSLHALRHTLQFMSNEIKG